MWEEDGDEDEQGDKGQNQEQDQDEVEHQDEEGDEDEEQNMYTASAIQLQVYRPLPEAMREVAQYTVRQPHKVAALLHFVFR